VNKNVFIVNNYPKIEEIEPVSYAASGKREPSLLYVGMRISRIRGAEEMVRAVGLLPAELRARLKFIGSCDPPDLPESLSSIPGSDRTEFVGPLDRTEIADELHRAYAGLVILHPEPNYLTSQPVKLFEYMCAGIPVIASDFPVCREIVTKARCGLLVDPLKPEEIAHAMEYLLAHPEEAEEMGRRGLQAVHESYNWANEEKMLLEIYRRLSIRDAAYQGSVVDRGYAP
jgi:glycosyltransferase involved in cell wall biosynthesis